MAVQYSTSTIQFLKDLTSVSNKPHDPSKVRTSKKYRKLYENDTSKFDPVPENREHLIHTLMPMVVKLAKGIAMKYNAKIEYDDCISAGMQGAIIATDIYIRKSAIAPQVAKLSTYAHSYIEKYIKEYCRSTNSLLSHGPTKWGHAAQKFVLSGNQQYGDEGRKTEFFDISNDPSLQTLQKKPDVSQHITVRKASSRLFGALTAPDKKILFMSFGVGSINTKSQSVQQIAKALKISSNDVKASLSKTMSNIRATLKEDEIESTLQLLNSTDLTKIPEWNL